MIHDDKGRKARVYLWLIAGLVILLGGVAAYLFLDRETFQVNPMLLLKLAKADLSQEQGDKSATIDWPQWRGPNRDGLSQETGLLSSWPEKGPKQLWEAKAGAGYSSVAVAGGRAYCLLQDQKDEAVVCWDAQSGQELWRFPYPCDYKNGQGNGPRSTPTVDVDRVYTVGATGIFHCLKTSN